MPRGGARPGAGRKRKSVLYESAINKAERRIADRLPRLIENLEALADGVTVQEETNLGGKVIYTRPPDRAANEYLANRVMGKPTEHTELEAGVELAKLLIDV